MARRKQTNGLFRTAKFFVALPARLHHDQQGSISVASVFALLLLVFILGMVMNSTRQVDQKVKMQNAADAATYSGGVVLSRSMNTLAYTNHLLSDVFALTAFMREARDRKAESLTPEILDNWERVGPALAGSDYPPIAEIGDAVVEQVPQERELIYTFSEWSAAASAMMLPVLEEILATHAIPEFQRALVATTPQLAQAATDEVARRHGASWPDPADLRAVLWRSTVDPVGGMMESDRRTLPVVDPELDNVPDRDQYVDDARRQRSYLAHRYLAAWNRESLEVFDRYARLSQFGQLFRIFSRGQLRQLLDEEYREVNLPFQIRTKVDNIDDLNQHLEQDFMFVGVVYNEQYRETVPGIFQNPTVGGTQAYAQIMVFVPRRRLVKYYDRPSSSSGGTGSVGIPGDTRSVTPPPENPLPGGVPDDAEWTVVRQWGPRYPDIERAKPGLSRIRWDLCNQNWSMQLTPATAASIPSILSSAPYGSMGLETADYSTLNEEDMHWLSHH